MILCAFVFKHIFCFTLTNWTLSISPFVTHYVLVMSNGKTNRILHMRIHKPSSILRERLVVCSRRWHYYFSLDFMWDLGLLYWVREDFWDYYFLCYSNHSPSISALALIGFNYLVGAVNNLSCVLLLLLVFWLGCIWSSAYNIIAQG